MAPAALTDEELFPDATGSQSGRKTSLSVNSLDVLSVNQLLESVSSSVFNLYFTLNFVCWIWLLFI